MGQARPITSEYRGPRDVGRAESLYRSALTKPDASYCLELLFAALLANPDHEAAFAAILSKSAEILAAKRKVSVRIGESLVGSPADDFIRSLAALAASRNTDQGIACALEAARIGLTAHAMTLGGRVLEQWEEGRSPVRPATALKLADVLETCGAFESAVRAVACAIRAFPDDATLREREKNLLANQYLAEHDPSAGDFRANLQDRARQEAAQRAVDPAAHLAELEQRYRQSGRLEDFREFMRAVREAPPERREAALPALQDGYERFGEKELLWFIREIRLERRWAEVRMLRQSMEEAPSESPARKEHERLRREVLCDQIEHLYEVVSALPPSPDRYRRELELARRLLEAQRYEEAVKQAQRLKGRPECRTDSWVIMAKAFVQMGLSMEAAACFESILTALHTEAQGSPERVLDAKYSYAEFLVDEAAKKEDAALAAQARKLCADVILEDIDYRRIRALSARADALTRQGRH